MFRSMKRFQQVQETPVENRLASIAEVKSIAFVTFNSSLHLSQFPLHPSRICHISLFTFHSSHFQVSYNTINIV